MMNAKANQPHRLITNEERHTTITLTCGCKRRERREPISPKTTFPCPSNAGHGYTVRWKSWVCGSHSGVNPEA